MVPVYVNRWGFFGVYNVVYLNPRWAKGGVVLQGARESVFTTKADHSFFTEPVSCLVFNAVGKTNVSILVDVHCESYYTHLTWFNHLWPTSLTTVWSQRDKTHHCSVSFSQSSVSPLALLYHHSNTTTRTTLSSCLFVSSRSNPVGGAAAKNS